MAGAGIGLLIDATHPFAAQISFNAAAAASECGLPHLMLVRPEWEAVAGDRWIEVESVEAAAATLRSDAKRGVPEHRQATHSRLCQP